MHLLTMPYRPFVYAYMVSCPSPSTYGTYKSKAMVELIAWQPVGRPVFLLKITMSQSLSHRDGKVVYLLR